jgi:hypothetical protein
MPRHEASKISISISKQGVMVHTYDPSYAEITVWGQPWAKNARPCLKITKAKED